MERENETRRRVTTIAARAASLAPNQRHFGGSSLPLVSLLLAALALGGCGDHPHVPADGKAPSDVRVQVPGVVVERKTRVATEEVVGTVVSRLRATVEAKVTGRIQKLPVSLGQTVKAGDLIAEVDAEEIQARFDRAVATRDQAAQYIERVRRLLADKVVSQAEYDEAQGRFRVAVAGVSEAETMLGYRRVTAPFDGVVTAKRVEVGDQATPGRALVDLMDPRQLRLEASVPETAISRLKLGDALQVRVAGVKETLSGVISEMAPSADSASRTFLIKADLPAVDGVRTGQFGRAEVPIGEAAGIRVPAASVFQRGQLEFVMVGIGNRAVLRIVKSGRRIGNETEIVSGLEPGEQIVASGGDQIREGQSLALEIRPPVQ